LLRKVSRFFMLGLSRRGESPCFAIPFRRRFRQRDVAIKAMQIQTIISVGYRNLARSLSLPFYVPGGELNRQQFAGNDIPAIKVVTNHYCLTETVGEAAREVDLLGCDSSIGWLQPDESTSDPKRSAVHIFVARNGREKLRRPLGNLSVTPKKLSGLSVNCH